MQGRKANIIFFSILGSLGILGCISHYSTTTETAKSREYENSFERGKNLAFNICGQCHYDEGTQRFMGKEMKDLPGFMGKVFSTNLTHSDSFGVLEKYSDAELAYLLKTGINREGKYVPWMIRPNLADTDINDITVYFRSNDTAVLAVDKVAGKTELSFAGKMGTKIEGKPLPFKKGILPPNEKDSIAYGRYLIDNLACYHCHSKSILGLDYEKPETSKGYMAGGMKFKNKEGKIVIAANLTPDKTGIESYTHFDFRKAVQDGVRPNGSKLNYPMQKFRHLTSKQSDAIYYYLQSLEPVKNKVKRPS